MKWPKPRFTVLRLMVTVAAVSVTLGALVRMEARSMFYRQASEAETRTALEIGGSGPLPLSQPDYARLRIKMDWHVSKSVIYFEASKRPWLPIAPIPSEPK